MGYNRYHYFQHINIEPDIYKLVDVLVKYLYNYKKSNYKTTLWSSFGDILVENLKRNLQRKYGEKNIQCDGCGDRIRLKNNKNKYCNVCAKKIKNEQNKYYYHLRKIEKILKTIDT
ncbi:hypothetical protein GCM10023228_05160 [Brevibacillus fulvus]